MAVTMKDIAKAAGVSVVTVSKIVNKQDRYISEETRQRVLEIIKASGYVPNSAARSLKTKSSHTIGFILPDISNPYYPEIARGIEDEARSRGYAMIICNTDNDVEEEKKAVAFLNSKMVDGVIYTHSIAGSNNKIVKKIETPLVVVDRRVIGVREGVGKVYVDTEAAMHTSTSHLLEKGCKHIALISAPHNGFDDRVEGYFRAIKEAGIRRDNRLVYLGQYDVETGYNAIEQFVAQGLHFDGVSCSNDLIALGVMRALNKHKIRVPEDVKVVGFDDIAFARISTPALTTVRQPAYEMGKKAAEMIIDYITEGKQMGECELPFALQVRETT